jgi:antitoxin component of MazEF toxin-antitoxin module
MSVPRAVLMAISLQVPARVEISIERGHVLIRARSARSSGNVALSKVGQMVLPTSAMEALGIDAGDAVYARVFDGEAAVELLPAAAVAVLSKAAK